MAAPAKIRFFIKDNELESSEAAIADSHSAAVTPTKWVLMCLTVSRCLISANEIRKPAGDGI
jgi:hypothetical protein